MKSIPKILTDDLTNENIKSFKELCLNEKIHIIDNYARIFVDQKTIHFTSTILTVRHGFYEGKKVAVIKYKIFDTTKYYKESDFYDAMKEVYNFKNKLDYLFNFLGIWFHKGFCFFITEFPTGTCLLECFTHLSYNEKLDIVLQIAENYNANPNQNNIYLVPSSIFIQNDNKIKIHRDWFAINELIKRKLGFHSDEEAHKEKSKNKDIYFHPPELYIDTRSCSTLCSNVFSLGSIITYIFSGQFPSTKKFMLSKILKIIVSYQEFPIVDLLPEEFHNLIDK